MMTTKRRFTVTVKRWRTEKPLGCDGPVRLVAEPPIKEVVEVEVNLTRIAQSLGPKACRSKGKRSQALGGLVVVRKV